MITVLNELVISSIKAEMAYQGLTQLDLANRMQIRPEYLQRRLSGHVALSVNDVEQIGIALSVSFLEPTRRAQRRASLCQVLRQPLACLANPPRPGRFPQRLPVMFPAVIQVR